MRTQPHDSRRRTRGFTLVELAVVVAVASILTTVAVPSFETFMTNQRLKRVSQTLLLDVLYARSEAIKLNTPVYMYPAGDDWNAGWVITTVSGKRFADCTADSTGCLRMYEGTDDSQVTVTTATASMEFGQMGRATADASFTVCNAPATRVASKRVVRVELSGHVATYREGQCA